MRGLLHIGALVAALAALPCSGQGVRVDIQAASLSGSDQRRLAEEVDTGLARVQEWWGRTFEGTLRVVIDANQRTSMALIPAWRGQRGLMLFPPKGVASGFSPVTHELIHVFATNQNRFLAEGLAVYGHQALGGRPGYPNFGRDLHEEARSVAGQVSLAKFDAVPTPSLIGRAISMDERVFYLAGGSFVRFLVERFGMEKFRELYALTPLAPGDKAGAGVPERWSSVFGLSLAELEALWRREALRLPG